MAQRVLDIVAIPGDGIGPELVDSALAVLHGALRVVGHRAEVETMEAGAGLFTRTGEAFPAGGLDRLRRADGVLKGPVGLPDVRLPDGSEAGLLGGVMRTGLDTFANLRPVRLMPGVRGATRHEPGEIDYVIVRENTEGLYLSRGRGIATDDVAVDQLLVTRAGVERVVRFAFELALTRSGAPIDGRRRVTCVDKSNVLRSFALFRRVFDEVAAHYPQVEATHLYADAAAHDLVVHPGRFDVVVTENFLGDILSDLGAASVGGLGMCPSGNIGEHAAYFEPIHGSAPTIAGQNRSNPLSQILSAALLLDHAGVERAGDLVRTAVAAGLADGSIAIDRTGQPAGGTSSVTDAVLARIDDPAALRSAV
ncbi:MAG: isocitrate/isopropylmalate family dehydrogenase [Pseudonocardia sediminis]